MGKFKPNQENGSKVTEVKVVDPGVKKKKKYRGKKKKSSDGIVVTVPKLKNLQKENISSNWKTLLQAITTSDSGDQKPTKKTFKKPKLKHRRDKGKKIPVEDIGSQPDIWFDDVDEALLEKPVATSNPEKFLVKERSFEGLTKIVGMDCEMVGVGKGGDDSVLARVSIVNHFGKLLYDTFVKPRERVTDYRTHVSGVRPEDLHDAPEFSSVQQKVSEMIKGRVLVGHAIHHDLKVLFLDHPRKLIRDTAKYKPFRQHFGGKTPSLKRLSERYIGVKVQTGEHSSVQDAQAAVRLYTMVRTEWEREIIEKRGRKFQGQKKPLKKLNNKSSELEGLQKDLRQRGTKQYVDSDDE